MHYAISMKVLGQTHIWYTQYKRSNFLQNFQFLWVFEFFNSLKNRTCKVRSTETTSTNQTWKETCENVKHKQKTNQSHNI